MLHGSSGSAATPETNGAGSSRPKTAGAKDSEAGASVRPERAWSAPDGGGLSMREVVAQSMTENRPSMLKSAHTQDDILSDEEEDDDA